MTLDFDLETIRTVCRRNDIAQLALFGSFVRGSERDDSDIDLLVIHELGKTRPLLHTFAGFYKKEIGRAHV